MVLPLDGIKVLELGQTVAAPFCGQMLGDLGAEIIKVEKFSGDESRYFAPPVMEGESIVFLANNRNKRSIAVNLKDPKGIDIVRSMARDCDVVIENFRTGTADRLGIGYEDLKAINPSIIYLSISGFGRTGPEKNRAGYDIMMQAYSGLMSITGEPDRGPVKVGTSVVDLTTGMNGVIGVMAALMLRDKTGGGQYVDCSLLDGQVAMLNYLVTTYFGTGTFPGKMGATHPSLCPYQAFLAKDQYVIIACGNDEQWAKACEALGWHDLLNDPRFKRNASRVKNRPELISILSKRIAELSGGEICEKLDAKGVPNSPINTIEQVVTSPQVVARGGVLDVPHPRIKGIKAAAFPVKISSVEFTARRHPPSIGEHTEEILQEYGYDREQIEQLIQSRVVLSANNVSA